MSTSRDIYQEVTDRIVSALENGTVPWHRPWNPAAGMPRNAFDNRAYTGMNTLLLGMSEYTDPRWGTFKAISAHGGKVRKGQASTLVIFFKQIRIKDTDPGTGADQVKKIPMLKHFNVFNVEQAEGLDLPELPQTNNDLEPLQAAEAIMASYPEPPAFQTGGAQAYYDPARDLVNMPPIETFESAEAYALTQWHEAVHSTGHSSRLDREDLTDSKKFGDHSYSREELTAEIGSAMIAARTGIVPPDIDQSAAYIASWLRVLRGDKKLIVSAAARAQKAADWILASAVTDPPAPD
jgi:antirestriction protein ArdC